VRNRKYEIRIDDPSKTDKHNTELYRNFQRLT